MLWSLLSSAFVIHLYRKLNTENEPQRKDDQETELTKALDDLNQRLSMLERRQVSIRNQESGR